MNSTPQTFPYEARSKPTTEPSDIGRLLRKGTVTTLLAQVQRVDLGWAGRLRCRLQTSIGELSVAGNRETVPLDLTCGEWVRVRVMRRYQEDTEPPTLLRLMRTCPDVTTAWVPTSLYHREAHMRRLRALLRRLEPSLQTVFMLAMSDAQVQRRFFWRVGAADHHGYPGGLFDQSVRAAELAQAQDYPSDHERGLATLAALLFDVGKVFDPRLASDHERKSAGLRPHPMTPLRLERALSAVEGMWPALPDQMRRLLAAPQAVGASAASARLARSVHAAVLQSWSEGSLHV